MARLSRRKVVATLGSAPLLADGKLAAATAADPVLLLCAHYGELARRQELLMRQWGDREAWLGDNRDWFSLSTAEQRALPEAQLLYAIDEEYERCVRAGVRIVRRLRGVSALTVEGAAAKLSVVAEVIDPEDYPGAHRVLLEHHRGFARHGPEGLRPCASGARPAECSSASSIWTPHLDFGKWRLHQVEVLGCYCDHESLCACP